MRERGRKDKKRWRGDEVRDEEVERGMRERRGEVRRRGEERRVEERDGDEGATLLHVRRTDKAKCRHERLLWWLVVGA